METMLAIFGAKWCCVFASTLGGLTNGLVHKWMGWLWELKNLAIAAIVVGSPPNFLFRHLWNGLNLVL